MRLQVRGTRSLHTRLLTALKMPFCGLCKRPRFLGHHPQPSVSTPIISLNPPSIVNEAPPSRSSLPSRPPSRANNSALTTSISLSQQQENPPHQVNDQVPATSSHPSDPPPSDLSALINAALKDYAKQTNIDLPGHPLSARIKEDDTLEAVIGVLSEALDDSGDATHRGNLMKIISPIVNVVLSISGTVGEAAGLPFPPAKAIFCGIGVLLSAAKDIAATDDALVDLFGSIRNFLDRLKIYTAIPPNPEMTRIIVKTMTELLSILALATNQLKESRLRTYVKLLLGDRGVLDAVQKLDKLTREEAQMTGTQILKITHDLMIYMKTVMGGRSPSMDGIQEALGMHVQHV
ncbi:hypothetical protein BJV78DRAFT_858316 [Lactifluus subvellereus]|nr:hypothetical protein BJV78DRAFT_858316 [Lactifluus subvellereus]